MILKLIHNSFTIIFPLVIQGGAKINYLCYVRYIITMSILGLLQVNNRWNNHLDTNFWLYYRSVTKFGFTLLLLVSAFNTVIYIQDFMASGAFICGVIIFYIYGLYGNLVWRYGLNDFIFVVFITQILLSMSEYVAYHQFDFKSMALFSPINLLCFTTQITYHAYMTETAAHKKLNYSEQSFLSAYRILGKEDSFRLMIMVFFYIWSFMIVIAMQSRTFMYIMLVKYMRPLIPIILITPWNYNFIKNFKNQQYEAAYRESKQCYLVFACVYLLSNFIT